MTTMIADSYVSGIYDVKLKGHLMEIQGSAHIYSLHRTALKLQSVSQLVEKDTRYSRSLPTQRGLAETADDERLKNLE